MSKPSIYDGPYSDPITVNWAKLRYGKCQTSKYIEKGYWFVHAPGPSHSRGTYTFIVDEEYAIPEYLGRFGQDITKWQDICVESYKGEWDFVRECLWKENPVYMHEFSDGTVAKFGPCRVEHGIERDIWYFALIPKGTSDKEPYDEAFIVESECVNVDFISRVGSNSEDWRRIAYTGTRYFRVEDGAMTDWDFEKGYKNVQFVLQSIEQERIEQK